MITSEEFIQFAKLRFLTDAIFSARVRLVAQMLDTPEDDEVLLGISCGLLAAYIDFEGKPTTPAVDYNLAYIAGLEWAAEQIHRKARSAYGRDHNATEDLLNIEEVLTGMISTLRRTNDRLLAEQTVRPTAQEKN